MGLIRSQVAHYFLLQACFLIAEDQVLNLNNLRPTTLYWNAAEE